MCPESNSEGETNIFFWVFTSAAFWELTLRCCVALQSHQKPKGHDLEDALHWEDDGEGHVQVLEHGLVRRRGGVVLEIEQRHRGTKPAGEAAGAQHQKVERSLNWPRRCEPRDVSLISPRTRTRPGRLYRLMEDSSRPINSRPVCAPLIRRTIKRVIPLGAAATVNEVILNSSPWTL